MRVVGRKQNVDRSGLAFRTLVTDMVFQFETHQQRQHFPPLLEGHSIVSAYLVQHSVQQ